MSSYYQNGGDSEDRDRKLSGLSKRTAEPAAESGRGSRGRGRVALGRRGGRWWVSLLVDLVLVAVVAGLIVGFVFAFRAVRELYAPTWEVRSVVFCVKMEGISPDMVKYDREKSQYTIVNNPIWSSEFTDADHLGTVTDVRTVLVSTGEVNTVTLYLKVEADAYYREGKGYRMGETLLLAGAEGLYRLEGLTAEGIIISMHELSEDGAAQVSWTDRFEQGEQKYDAQG